MSSSPVNAPSRGALRAATLVGLLACWPLLGHSAGCQSTTARALVERVMPADCAACWEQGEPPRPASAMVLDWIAPAGEGAAMQVAALGEATGRVAAVLPTQTAIRTTVLDARQAPRLVVQDGPAWSGYVGLQLTVHGKDHLPPEAVAYLALVERVAAGSEGSPVARQLVRAVTEPLPLEALATQATLTHLKAMRVPDGARPERLVAVGWVEAGGHVVAAGAARGEDCGNTSK